MNRMNKFLVGWGKGDEEREKRVESAMKIAHPVRVELVRSLLDEWAKIVLGRERSDIQEAAREAAKNGKRK